MLWRSQVDQSFCLAEFDLERITAAWTEGLPIVPVGLDVIYQDLRTHTIYSVFKVGDRFLRNSNDHHERKTV